MAFALFVDRAAAGSALPGSRFGRHGAIVFTGAIGEHAGRVRGVAAGRSSSSGTMGLSLLPLARALKEQQYQRKAPWVVDHSKFARAFGAEVTPHAEAISTTLDWFAKAT